MATYQSVFHRLVMSSARICQFQYSQQWYRVTIICLCRSYEYQWTNQKVQFQFPEINCWHSLQYELIRYSLFELSKCIPCYFRFLWKKLAGIRICGKLLCAPKYKAVVIVNQEVVSEPMGDRRGFPSSIIPYSITYEPIFMWFLFGTPK